MRFPPWLDVRWFGFRWLAAAVVFVFYALTMSRDLSLFDSAELALVAYELGLGHPPGQPLFTMLGYLFAHLPLVTPLVGLNLMSALTGALTVVPVTTMAERLLGSTLSRAQQAWLGIVVVIGALHPVLWEPATRVEVYSLATLLAVWGIERVHFALSSTSSTRALIVGALLIGLSASVNPVTALACTACVTPAILHALIQRRVGVRVLLLSIVAGLLGLLPYAYVLLVADRTDALVWGAPTTPDALWSYFSGHDYAQNTGIDLTQWLSHLKQWFSQSATRFGLPWLVVGLAAHLTWRTQRSSMRVAPVILAALCVGLVCANGIFRVDNPDYNGYLAAPLWLCVIGASAFSVRLLQRQRVAAMAVVVVGLASSLTVGATPVYSRSRADDRMARDLTETALQNAPPNALVIVESDHWIAPLLYLQRVEHLRPDVVVLGAGLTSSSWYWAMIARAHPSLRPFALRGPGGRDGRLQRFVASQDNRAVLVENTLLAQRAGVSACVDGALLSTRNCTPNLEAAHGYAKHLMQQLNHLGPHVPLATELTATLTQVRGEDLWRLGEPNAALHTLLAGVPAAMRAGTTIGWTGLSQATALHRPMISWQRERVLGDPARNLYLAAELLFHAGQRDGAVQLADAAARDGLPEASD